MIMFSFTPRRLFTSKRKAKKLLRLCFPEIDVVGKYRLKCFFQQIWHENHMFFTYRYHEIYNQYVNR